MTDMTLILSRLESRWHPVDEPDAPGVRARQPLESSALATRYAPRTNVGVADLMGVIALRERALWGASYPRQRSGKKIDMKFGFGIRLVTGTRLNTVVG